MRIKYIHIIPIILLTITASIFASAFLQSFTAKSQGENIVLNWQTGAETDLKEYVVTRATINNEFVDITKVSPKGSNSSYTYTDVNVFKTTSSVFIYKIKIVDNDGNVSYSKQLTVTANVSSVKRTWGSIKALFR